MIAFVVGGAVIWHLWWLALLGIVLIISIMIVRAFDDDTEYIVTADQLYQHDRKVRA